MMQGLFNVFGLPLAIVVLAAALGILARDKRKWYLRAGGVLLACGFLGPALMAALLAHPGKDQSDIGMLGTILMLIFLPSGLLLLGLGLAIGLWRRLNAPPRPPSDDPRP
ncbi:MAG: hypothetical protein HY922_10015 [Elusimicrobia bacterium]|nr:hypothetical protein [Elusimicrobiota bacterium]